MDVLLSDWEFERAQAFMTERFIPMSIKITAGYLITLYAGSRFMKSRPPLQLDRVLSVWNAFFSVFSIVTLSKLFPELLWTVQTLGVVGECPPRDT